MYFNLFFVFLVSGFWHGANWTFIIWGILHGFYSIFALLTKNSRKKMADSTGVSKVYWLNNMLDVFITFVLVTFAWIFFRANNIHDALFIVKKLGGIPGEVAKVAATKKIAFLNLPGLLNTLLPCFGLIVFLELAHIIQVKYNLPDTFSKKPALFRWTLYYAGLTALVYLGVYEHHQFIYFQF